MLPQPDKLFSLLFQPPECLAILRKDRIDLIRLLLQSLNTKVDSGSLLLKIFHRNHLLIAEILLQCIDLFLLTRQVRLSLF